MSIFWKHPKIEEMTGVQMATGGRIIAQPSCPEAGLK
jgi:hypothetical protein